MNKQIIIFLVSLISIILVVIFALYMFLKPKKKRLRNNIIIDDSREYDLTDAKSPNALLFGINTKEKQSDLEITQTFTPITQEQLEKYYNAENNLFEKNENELPKLK